MSKLFSSSIIFLLLMGNIFSVEKTGIIDYDMTTGDKPMVPLFNTTGKIDFSLNQSSVLNKFSAFEPEEQLTNGKLMVLRLKENDIIKHEFTDFDLNGTFENWKVYESGLIIIENRLDEKKEIIVEKTYFDSSGAISMVLIDVNHRGTLGEKNIYKRGHIIRTEKDQDGDGLFEEEIVYFEDDLTKALTEKTARKKFDGGKKIYVAGLYSHGDIIKIDKGLTKQLLAQLSGRAANKFKDIKSYQEIIFQETDKSASLERRYPNRFELYRAIALTEKTKSSNLPKVYVISGDIYRKGGRVSIYYRLLGPTPVDQVATGSVQMSLAEYNTTVAARKISKKILKSLQ